MAGGVAALLAVAAFSYMPVTNSIYASQAAAGDVQGAYKLALRLPGTENAVLQILKTGDDTSRRYLISCLKHKATPKSMDSLVKIAGDPSEDILLRQEAANALGYRNFDRLDDLAILYHSPDPTTRYVGAWGIGWYLNYRVFERIEDKRLRLLVKEMSKDSNPSTRKLVENWKLSPEGSVSYESAEDSVSPSASNQK